MPRDFSPRELRSLNLALAIQTLATDAPRKGLAFDISQELEQYRKHENSIMIPLDLPVTDTRAGLDSATSTKGQEIVFPQPLAFLDMLRIQSVIGRAGATMLTNLQGQVKIPTITAQSSPAWAAENPGSDVSDSNPLLASTALSPKDLYASTSFSTQLLNQCVTSSSVDTLVKADLVRAMATVLDAAAINGTGTNQPKGVLSQSGVGSVVGGTNGAQTNWVDLAKFEQKVAVANADFPTNAWVTTPTIRQTWRTKDRTPTSVSGWMIMADEKTLQLMGYPVLVSNSVPSNLTKGTSTTICHAIIFGNWADLIIGQWGPGIEIVVDPYKLKKQQMVEVSAVGLYDVTVGRPGAFAITVDALP